MATLRQAGRRFYVRFRYGGRSIEKAIATDPIAARAALNRVEATLLDLRTGRLTIPEGACPVAYIVSDGKATAKPKPPPMLG